MYFRSWKILDYSVKNVHHLVYLNILDRGEATEIVTCNGISVLEARITILLGPKDKSSSCL